MKREINPFRFSIVMNGLTLAEANLIKGAILKHVDCNQEAVEIIAIEKAKYALEGKEE